MLLVVAALPSELRAFSGPLPRGRLVQRGAVSVLRMGTGLARAREAARQIEALQPDAVLHVGLAGGLRGGLGMGDLVVVTAVSDGVLAVDEGGALPPPLDVQGVERLREALARLPDRMAQGALLTVDRFVPESAAKEAIGRAGPYLACEMEAAPVAEAARRCGAAYVGLRAISDPCDVDVVPSLRSPRAMLRLARTPSAAVVGWRSAKGIRRANASLERAVPVAVAAVQAMPSISRPASSTNSRGT